jgi:hypothetical protein
MNPRSAVVPQLSPTFREQSARMWVSEHLDRIATRVHANHPDRPLPHFEAEVTPPVQPLAERLHRVWNAPTELAAEVERIGLDGLLLLLGQRRTPATLTDARGIPPTTDVLLASASARFNPHDALTVSGRALAKHAHRSPDRFWGVVSGPMAERNAQAVEVLTRILTGRTWWNVFGHFAHETVFEGRLPTGHGARWGHDGSEFIGFWTRSTPPGARVCRTERAATARERNHPLPGGRGSWCRFAAWNIQYRTVLISNGFRSGLSDRMRAAMPARCGVAQLVAGSRLKGPR